MFKLIIETAVTPPLAGGVHGGVDRRFGLFQLGKLPIDAVPDITNRQVQINTVAPALTPEQIERQVTYPLETALAGIPGLNTTRSLSRNGFSQVTAIFTDATDIYFARQQVAERMREASEDLPDGASPMLSPVTTGLGEVLMWTVDFTAIRPQPSWPSPVKPAGRTARSTARRKATCCEPPKNVQPTCVPSRTGSSRRRCVPARGWPASIRSAATSRNTACYPDSARLAAHSNSAWPIWSTHCSVPTYRLVPVSCSVPAKAWWYGPTALR
ncbi:MAG: efflux RND transporter permease subunit [Stenotrophomonas sp.]